MKFNVVTKEGTRQEEMELQSLLVVGFAGKDIEKTAIKPAARVNI